MLDHYHVLGSREENSRNRSVKVKIVFDFIFFVEMISKTIYGLGITVTSVINNLIENTWTSIETR